MTHRFLVWMIGVWAVGGLVGFHMCFGEAFVGHITEDPTRILEKFLSLDKKGARLEARSAEVLKPFVEWPDEPVWGKVVVISQYQVIEDVKQWEIIGSMEAKIPVVYDVLGTMHWESVTFVPESYRETQVYHIKALPDRWQIIAPQLPPHVGRQRLLDFVRWSALDEPDLEKKARFAELKRQLEMQKE